MSGKNTPEALEEILGVVNEVLHRAVEMEERQDATDTAIADIYSRVDKMEESIINLEDAARNVRRRFRRKASSPRPA